MEFAFTRLGAGGNHRVRQVAVCPNAEVAEVIRVQFEFVHAVRYDNRPLPHPHIGDIYNPANDTFISVPPEPHPNPWNVPQTIPPLRQLADASSMTLAQAARLLVTLINDLQRKRFIPHEFSDESE